MVVEEPKKEEILELVEFETKYETEIDKLFAFKTLAESLPFKNFVYVQGPDVFFTKGKQTEIFARYRKAEHDKSGRAEFTVKEKLQKNSSVIRTETNWQVDKTPYAEIVKGAELMGFEYNTRIWKACHIYHLDDATLVFYTVKDESDKLTHFMEIEVKEELKITEEQGWEIIKKYEALLAPLGVIAQKRKRKSLFEMYRKVK